MSGKANSSDARLKPGSPRPSSAGVNGGWGRPLTPQPEIANVQIAETSKRSARFSAMRLVFTYGLPQKSVNGLFSLTQVDIQVEAFPLTRSEILAKLNVSLGGDPIGLLLRSRVFIH